MASLVICVTYLTVTGVRKVQKDRAEKKRLQRGTITYYPDSDNDSVTTKTDQPKRESFREKASRKMHRNKGENQLPRRNSEDTLVPDEEMLNTGRGEGMRM
ncbi:hypothetical protein CC79DRAFT_1328853 [Sarocladium strictum]